VNMGHRWLLGPKKKNLSGKWFAADSYMKDCVIPWLQMLNTYSSVLGYKLWSINT